jgi:hypothetical protein
MLPYGSRQFFNNSTECSISLSIKSTSFCVGFIRTHGISDELVIAQHEPRALGSGVERAWQKAMAFGAGELTPDERRDLMMGSDPAGGFTVPPEQFLANLIRKIDDRVYMRRLATKVVVTEAQDLGVPTLEANPADADWTSELAPAPDSAFGSAIGCSKLNALLKEGNTERNLHNRFSIR